MSKSTIVQKPRLVFLVAGVAAVVSVAVGFFAFSSPAEMLLPPAAPPMSGVMPAVERQGHVLVIDGYGEGSWPVLPLVESLRAAGFTVDVVDSSDGNGDIARYGQTVLEAARQVDGPVSLVGFSQGGLIARAAIQLEPERFGRLITIGTPHAGLDRASGGWWEGCRLGCQQMNVGSQLLKQLTVPASPDRWLSLYSTVDEVIWPGSSSVVAAATNMAVDQVCSVPLRHMEIIAAGQTARLALMFLMTGKVDASQC